MCGEKMQIEGYDCTLAGSPPHVRGKDSAGLGQVVQGGITPACAGKSR